jgi:hypothetical protein
MIDNLIPVKLSNSEVYFRELTFYEYKNICKMLLSDDSKHVSDCFNRIIVDTCIYDNVYFDIIDKFKCIITIRNTVLGNEVTFLDDGKKITLDISLLLDKDFDNTPIEYDIFTFQSPVDFYISSYDEFVSQCLVKVKDTCVKDLTIKQKADILNETSLSLTNIFKQIHDEFSERRITIFKDKTINIYNSMELLSLLKNIFQEDLNNILQFEYICMRNLNLRSEDFKIYTYPELKIFLNHLNKELRDSNQGSSEG